MVLKLPARRLIFYILRKAQIVIEKLWRRDVPDT
jgi:hypothetical protein